jgi:uncharacterized membrane protein YcaP (DUF421 family)
MEAVLRAAAIYVLLMVLFRLTGKRSLAQVTTFDLVLLLIISEATQQALLGEDFSITQAGIVIVTLLVLERTSDYLTWRFGWFHRWSEGVPTILVARGEPVRKALRHYHLDVQDVVAAGRQQHGLARLEEVQWAVLEDNGGISIVPWEPRVGHAPRMEAADPGSAGHD